MNLCVFWFSIFFESVVFLSLSLGSATAQIAPDRTLVNYSITPQNCTDCIISGGTRSGDSLFHSFEQFSIPTGGRAFFNNAGNIHNIFARVTGRSRSNIDGIIQANGTANLFLLNPNGIIFGRNASLDLGGSFLATTADRIQFRDGIEFSSVNPQSSQLLSISVPVGLQFGRNSRSIVNRSQASSTGRFNTLGRPVGLEVQADQTLALVGNGVFFNNGNLTARGGQVDLGSVAPLSQVSLTQNGTGYTPNYSQTQNFSDLRLSNSSFIDTSGEFSEQTSGGAIRLQGQNIRLTAGSAVNSSTYGGLGGSLQLIASDSLTFDSASAGTFTFGTGHAGDVIAQANFLELLGSSTPSSLGSQTLDAATGSAGDITINADRLSLQDGSRIEASTFSAGRGGNIRVQAETIEVAGSNRSGGTNSGIISQTQGDADAGSLFIDTHRLSLRDGGFLSTATYLQGNGGNLRINASESIFIGGVSRRAVKRNQYRSGIFVSAEDRSGTSGNVGALNINTGQLTVSDRGEISANNRGTGNPGTATINAEQLIVQSGGEIRAASPRRSTSAIPNQGAGGRLTVNADTIRVTGTGTIGSETFPSAIAAYSESSGNAGDLRITANTLSVKNGANISVSGISTGSAGNLGINARSIQLDQGSITAATQAGSGAEITLQDLDFLLLQNQSQLTAQAFRQANGGNINVRAPGGFVVAADNNNDILARAVRGTGGNITIEAQSILGLAERSATTANNTNDIDASSDFGAPGSVTLTTPDVDPSRGLTELPIDPIDASSLISQNCLTSSTIATTQGEFVITGRSGLPPSPNDPRNSETTPGNWVTLNSTAQSSPSHTERMPTVSPSTIVEAQGWTRDANGVVTLVAETPAIVQTPVVHQQCPNTLSRN